MAKNEIDELFENDDFLQSFDEDNREIKKEKKKSKEKKKFKTNTISSLYNDRFDVLKKYGIVLLILGIIFLFLTAFIIFLNTYKPNSEKKPQKKEIPEVVLDTQETSWKELVTSRINKIEQNTSKNIKHLQKIVSKELNKTLHIVNKNMQKIMEENKKQAELLNTNIISLNNKINTIKSEVIKNKKNIQNIKTNKPTKTTNFKFNGIVPISGQNKNKLNPIAPSKRADGNNNKTKIYTKNNTKLVDKEIQEDIVLENDTLLSTLTLEDLKEKLKKDKTNKINYTMKQGFVDAVLITGVNAPTFNGGKANPKPILLSIIGKEYVAGDFEADLEKCTVMATATGNIITGRAELLVTKISCNYMKNGKMYEMTMPVKGWVIGADGQYGVSGKLVDSAGKILSQSVFIGMAQGIANGISQSALQVTSNQNTDNLGQAFTSNALVGTTQGFSQGFNIVLDYYKKILDAYFPYISVKAGKRVTILFNGGEKAIEKQSSPIDITKFQNEDENGNTITNKYDEIEIRPNDF